MRMQMTSQIDAGGNDPIFLMFHGYGNDESEMMRILDAVYAPTRADAAPAAIAAVPSYISFRATYARPYMGGNYWYPDGCGVDERQRECAAVGDAVASLLDASAFAHRRKILIGFSQGGYLSYRLVKVHPRRCSMPRSCSVLRSWARNRRRLTPLPDSSWRMARRTARFRCPTSKRPIRSLNGPDI